MTTRSSVPSNCAALLSFAAGRERREWRVYTFFDGGYVTINDPLPEQDAHWQMASVGAGSRIRLSDHFNGSLDAGLPLISQSPTVAHDWLFTFRVLGRLLITFTTHRHAYHPHPSEGQFL